MHWSFQKGTAVNQSKLKQATFSECRFWNVSERKNHRDDVLAVARYFFQRQFKLPMRATWLRNKLSSAFSRNDRQRGLITRTKYTWTDTCCLIPQAGQLNRATGTILRKTWRSRGINMIEEKLCNYTIVELNT